MVRFSRSEWLSLATALLFSAFCTFRELAYPLVMDEASYWRSAADIWNFGVFHPFRNSDVRTYGYPLLLSPLRAFFSGDVLGGQHRFLLTALQFPLYVAAAFALRGALIQRFSVAAGRTAFCAVMLCFWNLLYMPYALTEVASVSITLLIAACVIRATRSPSSGWEIALTFFLTGVAVMIRPANLYLVPAVPVFFLVWNRHAKNPGWLVGKLLLFGGLGLALPLSIQLRNNVVHHQKWSPLTAYPLGGAHLAGGIRYLKYATLRGIDSASGIFFHNPFFHVEDFGPTTTPIGWYLSHPAKGIVKLSLSSFALVDQDLVRPYNPSPHPRLRWWGSLVNYVVLFIGGVGLWSLLPAVGPALAGTLAVAILCFFGLYAPATVEARFGLPLITLFTTMVPVGSRHLRAASQRSRWVAAGVLFVMACAGLSGWLATLMSGSA